MTALEKAIIEAGNVTALARKLGVRQAVVSNWKTRGVPATRCADIEAAVDGVVTREQLRPDVFRVSALKTNVA